MRRGAVLLVLLLAGCASPGEEDAFDAKHVDSLPHDEGFTEVFRVVAAGGARPAAALAFALDGAPLDVAWDDPDGALSVGDRFWFVAQAFDAPRRVEAREGGEVVWSAEYRGGAGEDLA